MLRGLIFDVDGTMADTEEMHRQAFNDTFLEMGLDWQWSHLQYKKLLEISGGKERIAHYIHTLPMSVAERKAMVERVPMIHRTKTAIYEERVNQGQLAFRPGVMRLLDEARSVGVRIGIATTTTLDNVRVLIDSAWGRNRMAWFDAIGAGDVVAHKKPAPDIYNLVLSTLRVPAAQCVAFEDSVNGLRAARAAGLATVVTPTQWSSGSDFKGAGLVLPHLGDDRNPFDEETASRIGAPMLGLPQLKALLVTDNEQRSMGTGR